MFQITAKSHDIRVTYNIATKKNFAITVNEEVEIADSASVEIEIEFDTDLVVVVGSKVDSKYTAIFVVGDKIAGDP